MIRVLALALLLFCLHTKADADEIGISNDFEEIRDPAVPSSIRPRARPSNVEALRDAPNPRANYSIGHYEWNRVNNNCDPFINRRGELGAWGQQLVQTIEKISPGCFYEVIDFSRICPKYQSFSKVKKDRFLAFFFASMAAYESSCRPDAQAQGTNDIADGLFQLEYSQAQRADAGRDPKYCAPNSPVDTQELDFQLSCVVADFSKYYCRDGKPVGYERGSYFAKLRLNSNGSTRAITKLAAKFPDCKK